MTKVEEIMEADIPKQLKLIRLYAVTQLNFRQPLGDDALDAMRSMTDHDTVSAIMFLGGVCQGADQKVWEDLLP